MRLREFDSDPARPSPHSRSPRLRSRKVSARVKDSAGQCDYTPPVPFTPRKFGVPESQVTSRSRWNTSKALASLLWKQRQKEGSVRMAGPTTPKSDGDMWFAFRRASGIARPTVMMHPRRSQRKPRVELRPGPLLGRRHSGEATPSFNDAKNGPGQRQLYSQPESPLLDRLQFLEGPQIF
jgi:hypothetical protein